MSLTTAANKLWPIHPETPITVVAILSPTDNQHLHIDASVVQLVISSAAVWAQQMVIINKKYCKEWTALGYIRYSNDHVIITTIIGLFYQLPSQQTDFGALCNKNNIQGGPKK